METVRRGYEPKDEKEFGPKAAGKLNASAQELLFLMNRGYDTKSASTFVGNHHLLSERQRLALARITSTQAALRQREEKRLLHAPSCWMGRIVSCAVLLRGIGGCGLADGCS